MMRLFKKICKHGWMVTYASNVLQQDEMGYPRRLCILECAKCGKVDQVWIDTYVEALKELETGESVLLEWYEI